LPPLRWQAGASLLTESAVLPPIGQASEDLYHFEAKAFLMRRGDGRARPAGGRALTAAASAQRALAAASARGRRPPKAGGGPTKYHQLAFRNSLHRIRPPDSISALLLFPHPQVSQAKPIHDPPGLKP
jgi:hypothetical protein